MRSRSSSDAGSALELTQKDASAERGLVASGSTTRSGACSVPPVPKGRLLSASCTTGWLDWLHGELWLLPDGLLRVCAGLAATLSHEYGPTVPDAPVYRDFDDSEITKIVATNKRNLWIPADQIARGSLANGLASGRLNLLMTDGRKIKLLWLESDPAHEPLRAALTSWKVAT
jgi:hypothetical protein